MRFSIASSCSKPASVVRRVETLLVRIVLRELKLLIEDSELSLLRLLILLTDDMELGEE